MSHRYGEAFVILLSKDAFYFYSICTRFYSLLLMFSTFNKQWSEANNALVDLLEFEIPKEDRKQDKVCQ